MQVCKGAVSHTPADGQGTTGRRSLHHDVEGLADGTPLQLREALVQPLREAFRQGLQVHESVQ